MNKIEAFLIDGVNNLTQKQIVKVKRSLMVALVPNCCLPVDQKTDKIIQELLAAYPGFIDENLLSWVDSLLLPTSGGVMKPDPAKRIEGVKRFVITSAQNNTDVNAPFLDALENYAQFMDAEILIGQFVYNKNGFQNGVHDDNEIWFDPRLQDYFVTESIQLADGLLFCGELNILPTAKRPLSGLAEYGGTNSIIVPHAKLALESIPTAKNKPAKLEYTTGCITQSNYIEKKTGQIAKSQHSYSALIVEIADSGNWFVRQLVSDETGQFYDLDGYFDKNGYQGRHWASGIVLGDIHAEKSDQSVLDCVSDLLDDVTDDNTKLVIHDLYDHESRNHHNRDSGHFLITQHGKTVEGDVKKAIELLNNLGDYQKIIVRSNHDDALDRWLNDRRYDWRSDTVNTVFYLELQSAYYNQLINGFENPNALEIAIDSLTVGSNDFKWLKLDDSYLISGIEVANHGHVGANGSRGNPNQFAKTSIPMITGHTHSASIRDHVFTVGVTGSLNMGYNKGMSSWSHSHCIIWPNGKRQMITMQQNGDNWEYRA